MVSPPCEDKFCHCLLPAFSLLLGKQGLILFDAFLGQTLFTQFVHMINTVDNAPATQKETANRKFHNGVRVGACVFVCLFVGCVRVCGVFIDRVCSFMFAVSLMLRQGRKKIMVHLHVY